ncbi:uncharacterized protein BDR25DRAFT_358500 [Lindgomyces ingoldianus]|uniref:Uncharacterized protein n=1 Tax=Lindgomyces ingoldianus TaxID=673940 RepID=A0ACB6QK45_9PLEO|nr:uncharacterized protein BDR25DRAFT_358500 [Lindgomyces ingoldianus]KAF2467389.1 hypothetical protein BDR25DRAFT_358500 [Lindgomyces ingoldianus]
MPPGLNGKQLQPSCHQFRGSPELDDLFGLPFGTSSSTMFHHEPAVLICQESIWRSRSSETRFRSSSSILQLACYTALCQRTTLTASSTRRWGPHCKFATLHHICEFLRIPVNPVVPSKLPFTGMIVFMPSKTHMQGFIHDSMVPLVPISKLLNHLVKPLGLAASIAPISLGLDFAKRQRCAISRQLHRGCLMHLLAEWQ